MCVCVGGLKIEIQSVPHGSSSCADGSSANVPGHVTVRTQALRRAMRSFLATHPRSSAAKDDQQKATQSVVI